MNLQLLIPQIPLRKPLSFITALRGIGGIIILSLLLPSATNYPVFQFSGSCSERMVRAPEVRSRYSETIGGQRLNHEDCKVAGLQRSRSGEATGTIDQRRNDPWVGSFSICSLTAKFDIQSFDESRW